VRKLFKHTLNQSHNKQSFIHTTFLCYAMRVFFRFVLPLFELNVEHDLR